MRNSDKKKGSSNGISYREMMRENEKIAGIVWGLFGEGKKKENVKRKESPGMKDDIMKVVDDIGSVREKIVERKVGW